MYDYIVALQQLHYDLVLALLSLGKLDDLSNLVQGRCRCVARPKINEIGYMKMNTTVRGMLAVDTPSVGEQPQMSKSA
jgi:hypothetical protein